MLLTLLPTRVLQIVVRASEELLGKLGYDVRIVVLAREYVQVHCIRLIREVRGDKGCLDELCHRISRYPLVFAEIHDEALSKPFHFDELTELNDKPLDLIRTADCFGIASVDVNRRV